MYVCDDGLCDYKSKYVPRACDQICTQCVSGTMRKEVRTQLLVFQNIVLFVCSL